MAASYRSEYLLLRFVFIGGLLQIDDIPEEIILSESLALSLRLSVACLGSFSSSASESSGEAFVMPSSVDGVRLRVTVVGEMISLRRVTMEPLLPNSSTLFEIKRRVRNC